MDHTTPTQSLSQTVDTGGRTSESGDDLSEDDSGSVYQATDPEVRDNSSNSEECPALGSKRTRRPRRQFYSWCVWETRP